MRIEFVQWGSYFATRERGAKVRAEIEAALKGVSGSEPLVLDFDRVQMISFSFADEVVGKLVTDRSIGELGERPILVVNAVDEVVHPMASSMERRRLVVACRQLDDIHLIGAPGHVQSTFEAAAAREEFRTTELAAELGITVQALNNRLKSLLAAGVLVRHEAIARTGGREYIYRVALPSLDAAAA